MPNVTPLSQNSHFASRCTSLLLRNYMLTYKHKSYHSRFKHKMQEKFEKN